jgi:tetratricopeptide (TPR) repeat protein
MPVLVEAISVIIRRDALDRRFPGGLDVLARHVPNQTFCCDDHLARVGFMNPSDVRAFAEMLESHGMVFENGGEAIDFAIVDQLKGSTVTAPWLGFAKVEIEVGEVSACWLHGAADSGLAVPAGWEFEGSLSANNRFIAAEDMDDRVKFLRRNGDLDVYLDLRTGKEIFAGRPLVEGGGTASAFTQFEKLFHETLQIEAETEPLKALGDTRGLVPLIGRLERELLSKARELASGVGRDMAGSHFVVGLILRVLSRQNQAEPHFRRANELQPGVINTLRELVRCLGEQGKHQEALPFARETVKHYPDDAGAWGNLAMCLIQCGEREEAREAIRQALVLDPADPINRMIRDNFDRYFENR